ncbi:MAG: extracellular solute-binding protein [Candidatus Lindowbacteria bacterium]|nr:extracellular solute-binding protein [Candidatus Lindowbacteria bacterium]
MFAFRLRYRGKDAPSCPQFFALIVLLLAVALLCLSRKAFAEKHTPKTDVRLWHQWAGKKREIFESIIDDFNCHHENLRLHAEALGPAGGTVAERMLMQLAVSEASGMPDLALVERQAIPLLADAGAIVPLDEFPESFRSRCLVDLSDTAVSYGIFGGRLYGIPTHLNPFVLIYNPSLLREVGLVEPPSDWGSLSDLANGIRTADRPGGKRFVLSVRSMAILFNLLCLQKGVDVYELNSNPEEVGAATRDVLGYIRELRRNNSMLSPHFKYWDPSFADVANGKAFFQIDDAAMVASLLKENTTQLAVGMVPGDAFAVRTGLSDSPVFVVSKTASDPSAIAEFLSFFYSFEGYAQFARDILFVPPYRVSRRMVETAHPRGPIYAQLAQASETAGTFPLRRDSGTMSSEVARVIERFDAGLISQEQAVAGIRDAVSDKQVKPSAASYPPPLIRATWAESTRRLYATNACGPYEPPIEITCTRNEHETFQLALSSDRKINALTMEVARFTSSDGGCYEFDALTYLEEDTLISTPLVAEMAGLYPNVLRKRAVFDIVPEALMRIWVDLFVPKGAVPGRYDSFLSIESEETGSIEIPIHLEVLPLTIPAAPSKPAVAGLSYDLVAKHYGVQEGTDEYRRLADSFYWFLVERRLSPYEPPISLDNPRIASYLANERVSACRIPFPPDDPRFENAISLARRGGWLDKLFVYFIDEPTYHQYEAIILTGKTIHSSSPHPKFLVTCFPDELLVGAVDIWCVHLQFLPEGLPHSFVDRQKYFDAVRGRLSAGDEVWWYTAGGVRPFPTLHIEDDPAAFRIVPWLQQLYGIRGFLHWETANWRQPFDEPFIPYFGNGEGVLVYPDDDMEPAPSVRLELLREGLEDMELLVLLRQGLQDVQAKLRAMRLGDAGSVRVREICRELITDEALRAYLSDDVRTLSEFVREPGRIERARRKVAEETTTLEKRPFALVLTQPEEKSYTRSADARIYGVSEPGCRVEINGVKLKVNRAGEFSVRFPLASGTNIFHVRLTNGQYSKTITREIRKF